MAQILFNNSYKAYPTKIDDFLDKIVIENNLNKFIIVVPTQKLVRHLKQKLIRKYFEVYQKPISNIQIYNLKNFIENCYDRIYNDRLKYQISEPYKMLLFEEAIEKSNLSFYSKNKKRLSTTLIEKLSNVVYGLKEDGITIENIEEELKTYDPLEFDYFDEKRIQDILSIYKEYENLLEDKHLDDITIIQKIIKKFEDNLNYDFIKQIYPEIEMIFLFGFTEFKVPEYKFLSFFATTEISMSIVIDYSILNGPIFGNLETTIEHFLASGFKITENEDKYKNIKESDLINNNYNFEKFSLNREIYLRKWLFNHYHDLKTNEFNNLITIIGCQDKQDEAETIAKLVKYYILVKNYKPSDICIVSRMAESFSEIFRETFSLYQIPYNVSDRYNLNRSPIVISIISLLNVVIYGYSFDDLSKTLNNRYIEIEGIDKDNLLNVATKLKIIGGNLRGGYINWQKMIEVKIKLLENFIIDNNFNNDNQSEKREYEFELENCKKAYKDLNKIIDIFPKIPRSLTYEKFIDIIENDIIKKFSIKEKIEKSLEKILENKKSHSEYDNIILLEGIEKDSRALNTFIKLINEISTIQTLRYGNKTYPRETIIEKIKIGIEATKYQIKEKQNFGVNITSIEQTRGIPYKLMILCGANDGDFPLKYRTDTIVGKELKDSFKKHLKSERLLFYQFLTNNAEALNNGTKEIFITYSQFESDEYLVRSSFIDSLLKITALNGAGKVITTQLLEKNKSTYLDKYPWFYTISNLNSLFDYAGQNLDKTEYKNYIPQELINLYTAKLSNLNSEELSNNINPIKNTIETFINKPFSITSLELYIKCPFKFLSQKIFNLKTEELEIDFGLTPATKGSILHKVLKVFYESQKNEILINNSYDYRIDPIRNDLDIILPIELRASNKKRYLEQLKDIYIEIEKLIKNDHPYFKIDSDRILGNDGRIGDLEFWLDSELSRIENGWHTKPVLFELSFGISPLHPIQPIQIQDNLFQGRIDRIELLKKNNEYYFLIADYKLANKDLYSNKNIIELKSLQMPVYLAATQQILEKYYEIKAKPIGGVYYFLTPSNKSQTFNCRPVLIEKDSFFKSFFSKANSKNFIDENQQEEILNDVFQEISEIKKRIINLEFAPEPDDEMTCNNCNYKSICKINQRELK